MQYSPKLKRIAAQMEKILKDNDVAGLILLHTPGHGEFVLDLSPSYSCAVIDNTKGTIAIKGKLEHFGGNKALRDKKLQDTVNMLHNLSVLAGKRAMELINISELADKTWNAEHRGSGDSSHTEQNN